MHGHSHSINLPDGKEYFWVFSKDKMYRFELYIKQKQAPAKRILTFGSSDLNVFEKDIIFVIGNLIRYGIKDKSLSMYLA